MWLSPEQVRVLPISEKFPDRADEITAALKAAGVRTTCDARSEKIGYKIARPSFEKVNYMLIVGEKRGRKRHRFGSLPATRAISAPWSLTPLSPRPTKK